MGEKFSKRFADKIDQMQTRLPAVKVFMLHVEASRAASSQRSHHPATVRTSGHPWEASLRAKPAQHRCPKSQSRAQRALTGSSKKMNVPQTCSSGSVHADTNGKAASILQWPRPRTQLSSGCWLTPTPLCSPAWLALSQEVQGTGSAGIQY